MSVETLAKPTNISTRWASSSIRETSDFHRRRMAYAVVATYVATGIMVKA